VGAGVLGVGGDRGRGEIREDGKGIRFPYLIWAVMVCRDGSVAAGGEGWCRLMAVALGGQEGEGGGCQGARRGGEPRRPFYRRGKVGSGEDF
jgi:hypothetical protein